jgi:hypothetical protein
MSRSSHVLRSLGHLVALAALTSTVACKKTEPTTEATKPSDPATPSAAPAPAAPAPAAPAAAEPAPSAAPAKPAAAGATKAYTNPDPAFTIQVPDDFVANAPIQTGANNTSIRFARPDEHSGNGTFVSVTWWKKTGGLYAQLLSQKAPPKADRLEDKEIAGGKGKFFYGTKMSSRMVDGELKDAKQYVGSSVVEGPSFVLSCTVDSFDEPPPPAFIRACETLAFP